MRMWFGWRRPSSPPEARPEEGVSTHHDDAGVTAADSSRSASVRTTTEVLPIDATRSRIGTRGVMLNVRAELSGVDASAAPPSRRPSEASRPAIVMDELENVLRSLHAAGVLADYRLEAERGSMTGVLRQLRIIISVEMPAEG